MCLTFWSVRSWPALVGNFATSLYFWFGLRIFPAMTKGQAHKITEFSCSSLGCQGFPVSRPAACRKYVQHNFAVCSQSALAFSLAGHMFPGLRPGRNKFIHSQVVGPGSVRLRSGLTGSRPGPSWCSFTGLHPGHTKAVWSTPTAFQLLTPGFQ